MNLLKAFFSNKIEILFHQLKIACFDPPSPFTKRLIIVPNQAVKSWLSLQFASDPEIQIAAGCEMIYWGQAYRELTKIIFPHASHKKEPSPLELSLAIEMEIKQTLKDFSSLDIQEQLIWKPLLNHIRMDCETSFSRKSERRLIALSEKLTHHFLKYGCFGEKMVAQWGTSSADWQELLWNKIFNASSLWSYPAKEINNIITNPMCIPNNLQIHLFALNFLPRIQHKFLAHIATICPVNYFLLSPCRAFWLDIKSDWEANRLQSAWMKRGISEAKQVALEEFLRDRNALLANYGRLGREMASQIEEADVQTFEAYEASSQASEHVQYEDLIDGELLLKDTNKPLSILEAIQADMLLLRNPDSSVKIDFESTDNSIQLHTAHSPFREVEILYSLLLGIISDHSSDSDPISPKDIIVMTPDIMQYEAYIKAIFGRKDSTIDFQILDLHIPTQSSLVRGFLDLLNLSSSRWDAPTIMQLFEYEEFQRKHKLSGEDIHTLHVWIKESGILWGNDPMHRNELLQRDHCEQGMVENSSIGTWEHGLSRLLMRFALVLQNNDELPHRGIEASQAELLGKLILLIRSLQSDLQPLSQQIEMTLSDWADYLNCLCEAYFTIDSQDNEAKNDLETLKQKISELRQSSEPLSHAKFGFSSIRKRFESLLNQESICYHENHLQAVRFCSLLPMRAIPSKVICLLGMSEGVFPKIEENSSLNLMQKNADCDFNPSSIDYDRFLFLEILLSARQYILFLCSHSNNQNVLPSLPVSELFSYLDKAYTIEGKKVSEFSTIDHPYYPFDKKYFQGNKNYRNYFHQDFLSAQSYYGENKNPPHLFIKKLSPPEILSNEPQESLYLNLKLLNEVARNPLKTYFNNALGIYLKSAHTKNLRSEESFIISPLDNSALRKAGLTNPPDHVISYAENQGAFPSGMFKWIAQEQLKQDIEESRQRLERMGVNLSHIGRIQLSSDCQEPFKEKDGTWISPPIEVNYRNSIIKIVGEIPNITSQGLIVHGKNDSTNLIKIGPQYLLLLKMDHLPIAKQLLWTKSDGSKSPVISNPNLLLERYLHYYFSCLENVSILFPEWISTILEGDADAFHSKIQENLSSKWNPTYNEYLLWAFKEQFPKDNFHFEFWNAQAMELYGELLKR